MYNLVDINTPPSGAYFLTQTLKPAFYKLNARRQILETRTIFKNLLKRYSDDWQFTIELTKSANVHYHAWIVLREDSTISRMCLIDDLKLLGNAKLDTIKKGTEDNIRIYLIKDLTITDQILNYTKKGSSRNQKVKIVYKSERVENRRSLVFPPSRIISTYNNTQIDFDEDILDYTNEDKMADINDNQIKVIDQLKVRQAMNRCADGNYP